MRDARYICTFEDKHGGGQVKCRYTDLETKRRVRKAHTDLETRVEEMTILGIVAVSPDIATAAGIERPLGDDGMVAVNDDDGSRLAAYRALGPIRGELMIIAWQDQHLADASDAGPFVKAIKIAC